MGAAEIIAKRPLAVVALWIVLAVAAAPLFAKLSTVVKEQQYTLPENSETVKASRLLEKVTGGEGSVGVIVVTGVNLHDNNTVLRLVEWGKEFNDTVTGRYMKDVNALPVMLASVNETLYEAMLEAVNASTSHAREIYESFNQIDEAYASGLENATKQVELINKSITGLVQADRGYAEAYRGLLNLTGVLNQTITGIAGIDLALVNATDKLLALAEKLNETALGLQRLDEAYSGLYQGLVSGAQQLKAVLSNTTLVGGIEQAMAYTWWQVGRAYYYLEAYNGSYEAYAAAANLTMVDPQLAPLPQDQAIAAWMAVKSLVEKGLDPDTAAAQVAGETLADRTPPEAKSLLPVLTQQWLEALAEAKKEANVTEAISLYQLPPRHVESQLQVLGLARKAASTATERITAGSSQIAATLLAQQLAQQGLPMDAAERLAAGAVEGTLSPRDVAALVAARAAEEMQLPGNATAVMVGILVESDPEATGLLARGWDRALAAAEKLLESLGAPRPAVEAAARVLANGLDRGVAAEEAARLLEAQLPSEAAGLVPAVLKADPEAQGKLASPEAAAELAAGIVYEAAKEKGMPLPREVVEKLALLVARGEASPEKLRELALGLLEQQVAEKTGDQEQARLIAEAVSRFDPLAEGRLATNETLAVEAVLWMAGKQGMEIPLTVDKVEEMLHSKEAVRRIVAEMLREQILSHVPEEARPAVERIVEVVVKEGPGVPEDRKWSVIEDTMREMAEKNMDKMKMGDFEPPKWLPEELARLSVEAARGETTVEEAARLLTEKLLLGSIYPRLLRETEGLLVSSDHTAFLVMGELLGETQDEKAENTVAAGREAEKLLGGLGIAYEKVYVSGSDLLMNQVKEYARKDVEGTSRYSELGTFIVLLLILESVFAVILPYLGIFLGLVVGGALAYLAASHGWIDLNSQTQALMMTTALGLGADYAGYIVHRFREEYAKLGDAREAARRALKRAGPAVVASALTVIIGFGSLLLGWDIGFLRSMGEAIPITVAATAFASLTLVPALLALVGGRSWFWWPRRPSKERHVDRESRVMKALLRYEVPLLAAMAALILVSGYFYVNFKGSHDMKLMLPSDAPALEAFDVLKKEFMPGASDPVYVVAVLPRSLWSDKTVAAMVDELTEEIASVPGVAKVMAPTRPTGAKTGLEEARKAGGTRLTSEDGRIAVIQVLLGVDPYSREGEDAIREIHRIAHNYAEQHGFEVYVGGAPYGVLEMDELLHQRYYYRILPAASLLMVLVFTAIFGSLVASIAALAVIMGAAMMGITASILVFQEAMGKQVVWFLHIVSMMAVLGVGMDYNSFFLARALEECHRTGCDPKKAVARAAGAVSLFIVGLSLVVTSAYASMLTASNIGMQEMGFTLAATVLLAGLMSAYLLTPLVVSILGRHAWWPWGMKKRIEH
ncbi:MMPL family transporter [Pyrodictium abyssi]